MTRCLVVQHVEPEGPYALGDALEAAGVTVERCRVFAGDRVPAGVAGYDGVIVMGGPMSAAGGPLDGAAGPTGDGDGGFTTCRSELELLRSALDACIPTLGVCLGAQLLARAGGATVVPGANGPEIGWGPLHLAAAAGNDALLGGITGPLTVLHWHGDTFDLPRGAVHLASSPRYAYQAFRLGPCAWGIQCHLEVDHRAMGAFLAAFGDEAAVVEGGAAGIEAATGPALEGMAGARDLVAGRFARLVAEHAGPHPALGGGGPTVPDAGART